MLFYLLLWRFIIFSQKPDVTQVYARPLPEPGVKHIKYKNNLSTTFCRIKLNRQKF
jgi:hypothetical protein